MKKFLFILSFLGCIAHTFGQYAATETTLYAFRNFQGNKPGRYIAGPVTINSGNPSDVRLIDDQTSLGRIYAGEYVNYKWYAMITKPGTQSGVEGLAEVDIVTGERKIIAASSKSKHLTDMTYDYTTQTMFAITGSAEQLARIDLKTSDVTVIKTFNNKNTDEIYALALACDLDGKLYMISTEDTLYTVNKEDAYCTPVGCLEADAAFTQTMAFDHNTHTLYWTNNADYTLYTVNITTGKATSIGKLGADGMDSMGSLFIPYIKAAKGAPDRVTNRKTESFSDKIILSWTYPSIDAQGNKLSELAKATVYRDNERVQTLILTPSNIGQTATYTDTGAGKGKHVYRIVCENSKGTGGQDDDDIAGFVGENRPGSIRNFTVVSGDNAASLSWDTPDKGEYGGVYNPLDLKGYIIYRLKDATKEEITLNDPAATHYSDPTGFGRYAYSIAAINSVGTGATTTSPTVIIKPDDWQVMCNGEFTVTGGKFYDSGGPEANYQNAENLIMTLKPALPNSALVAEFTEFSVDNYGDTLFIYDGIDASSKLIGKYSSLKLPADLKKVIATSPEGALTFRFYSDVSFSEKGWSANLSCLQKKEYDLVANKIEGTFFPTRNEESEYKVFFQNLGINKVNGSSYKIQLTDENNRMIGQVDGVDISSMESRSVSVKYTPLSDGILKVKGTLTYENDNDQSNNATEFITLNIQKEGSRFLSIGNNAPALAVLPASFFMEESLGEILYTASQLQITEGMLQMISFPMKAEMSYNPVNVKVWIAETDRADLESGNIFAKDMSKVFEGNCPIQSGDSEWTIVFTTPYAYTGKNLVILIQKGGSDTANMGIQFCGTYGDPEGKYTSCFTSSEEPIDPDTSMDEYSGSTIQPDIRMLFTKKESGISAPQGSNVMAIYPNPFDDYIQISSNIPIRKVTVSDLAGKEILSGKNSRIDTSTLEKGVYILTVVTEKGQCMQQKVIKK